MPAEVEAKLEELLLHSDKPSMAEVEQELRAFCSSRAFRPIARASLYNALARMRVPALEWPSLPEAVRQALYNFDPSVPSGRSGIPGDQVVFYAFNYGSTAAISFASALPWLCLRRAVRRPGWRPKSKALLQAIMKYRGI